jgi:PhnB protein
MEQSKRQSITPALTVNNAEAAIAFYQKIFGAKLDGQPMRFPDGRIMHAELILGDMKIFVQDECPEMNSYSPAHYGGTSVSLMLGVPDVDRTHADAIAAGATSKMPPADMFWGDRYAYIFDPFGHGWGILTPKEKLTPQQIEQRARELFSKQPANR